MNPARGASPADAHYPPSAVRPPIAMAAVHPPILLAVSFRSTVTRSFLRFLASKSTPLKRHSCPAASLRPLTLGALLLLAAPSGRAQVLYWDTNDTTSGSSGGTTAAGTWDGSIANWTTASDGTAAAQAWIGGADAVFSAGTNATGAYTVTLSGTLTAGSVAFALGDLTLSDGTLQAPALSAASGASGTIASTLTGSSGVTKTGAGTVTLSAANDYSGDTIVDGGVLGIDGAGTTGTTANIYAGYTADGTLNLTGGGVASTSSYVILGYNAGVTGSITVDGTGSQLLSTLNIDIGLNGHGTLTVGNGATVATPASVILAYDAGASGTLNLNSGGILQIKGSGLSAGSGTATVNFAGGTLEATGDLSSSLAINLSNTSTIATGAHTVSLTGILSDSGGLTKTGSGTLLLTADNTYTGTTTISAGILQLGNGTSSGSLASASVVNNAQLVAQNNATSTISGDISGTGTLLKQGSGTLILTGDNGYTGTTTISAGTLQLGNGDTTGALTATTVVNNAQLAVNRSNDVTLPADVSGTGTLLKQGAGTLTLTGTDTFSAVAVNGGSIAVPSGGTLQFGGGNSLTASNGGTLILSGGTFKLGGADFSMFVPTTLTGTSTFDTNSYNGGIYGPLSGSGGFTKTGSGVLTVTNSNTFSGAVSVNAGTLLVNTASDLGTGNGAVTANAGASLAAATHLEFARTVTVTGADAVIVSPNHLEVGSAGDGALTVSTGGLIASGTTTTLAYYNTDTGTATITGTDSTLYAQNALRVGYGGTGTLTVASGGTANAQNLVLASQSGSTGTIHLNTGGTLQVGGADGIAIGSGTGTFNLAGGTLKVGGDSRATAAPPSNSIDVTNLPTEIGNVIAANTPQAGDTGLTTSVPMTLSNASTIDTNGSAAVLSGILSGTGSLTKSGTGTLTLNAANTYSGATTISAGTLALGAAGSLAQSTSISVASGAVFDVSSASGFGLASGQTLGGTGSITGPLTVGSGAHLAPGSSPGTLTFASGLTLLSGTILDFELGSTSDLIAVTGGTLTGPGGTGGLTLNLADAGDFNALASGSYTLFNFVNGGTSDFDVADFAFGTLLPGTSSGDYGLTLGATSLVLNYTASAVPEPSTYAAIFGAAALALAAWHRRRFGVR